MRHKGIENQILELKTAHVMSGVMVALDDYGLGELRKNAGFIEAISLAIKLALYELEG